MGAIVIVGCGGIGSALFQDIARTNTDGYPIVLIDGDRVEGKNIERQHFSKNQIGMYKSEALAMTANSALGICDCKYITSYLGTGDNYLKGVELLTEAFGNNGYYGANILVGCVDNHPARLTMEKFCISTFRRTWYIDCANSVVDGEVVYTTNGKNSCYRSDLDPNVLIDKSHDPTEATCSDEIQEGDTQRLVTNRKAAIIALELIHKIQEGKLSNSGVCYFNEAVIKRDLS